MEAYKQRMVAEYQELKERAEKLAEMMDKWENGTLDYAASMSGAGSITRLNRPRRISALSTPTAVRAPGPPRASSGSGRFS